jgi:hypothetical protein
MMRAFGAGVGVAAGLFSRSISSSSTARARVPRAYRSDGWPLSTHCTARVLRPAISANCS